MSATYSHRQLDLQSNRLEDLLTCPEVPTTPKPMSSNQDFNTKNMATGGNTSVTRSSTRLMKTAQVGEQRVPSKAQRCQENGLC